MNKGLSSGFHTELDTYLAQLCLGCRLDVPSFDKQESQEVSAAIVMETSLARQLCTDSSLVSMWSYKADKIG